MVSVICDSCKKSIPDAHRDVNYMTMFDKSLCVNCTEKLDAMSKESMRSASVYTIKGYTENRAKFLNKLCK